MTYRLIKGEFYIFYPDLPRNGPQPDGDTVKFHPDNAQLVEQVGKLTPGVSPDFNKRGMVNLRFEGIDALETHFAETHQQLQWANSARDRVLQEIGFQNVVFWPDMPNNVQSVQNHPRPGYILSNGLDGHGRVVSFVFVGNPPQVDGSEIFLDETLLDQSLNAKLLKDGLYYPMFYTSMPIALKEHLANLTLNARTAKRGLWVNATASKESWATIRTIDELQELVMWPKLFRRLVSFFGGGNTDLVNFDHWLRQDPKDRDDRLILPNRELGNMHDVVEVDGHRLRMTYQPEELIVLPDNATTAAPAPSPSATVPTRKDAKIRIIAALVNPKGTERGNEVVTLLNITPEAVDLTGWNLMDRSAAKLPLNGTLAAGGIVQFKGVGKFSLANTGDTITLVNPQGEQIDQVPYTAAQAKREGYTLTF